MTATNDSMTVSREMKVLFLQMLKQGEITKADAEGLVKMLVDNGIIDSPTLIGFQRETDEGLYQRMKKQKIWLNENPEYKHVYRNTIVLDAEPELSEPDETIPHYEDYKLSDDDE